MRDLLFHYWETTKHKGRVFWNILKVCRTLIKRGVVHDFSKYGSEEAEIFAEVTPELEGTTYGSEKYERLLDRLGTALDHHYKNNSHHPEHYDGTVESMPLLDLIEMLCDWEAATHRHEDGDILESIEENSKDYEYDEDMKEKFREFYEEIL
jgi:hypothetical protein